MISVPLAAMNASCSVTTVEPFSPHAVAWKSAPRQPCRPEECAPADAGTHRLSWNHWKESSKAVRLILPQPSPQPPHLQLAPCAFAVSGASVASWIPASSSRGGATRPLERAASPRRDRSCESHAGDAFPGAVAVGRFASRFRREFEPFEESLGARCVVEYRGRSE